MTSTIKLLCIYIFSVHDCVRTKSLMYYYPEVEMKKEGSEVASENDHKIHLRGHTRLPNDTDFAKIDEAEQIKEVHLPSEYEQLIRDSVRGKGRFSKIKNEQKMVFDMKKLCKDTRKAALRDIENDKVLISEYRWFSYGQSQELVWGTAGPDAVTVDRPGEVWMRKTLDKKEP
ncbi:hypothetical protein LOTGIDRAFT_161470 [Lottia gigantea]|uniref:Uncharacterized protein n=1 Tax=Lottia gigantea TaxID=225164 RepID=V4AGG1_LOTGI|nr:hypothetical protein LOTGIDRAFT_161470 [Lottia gigantea]ESO94255.1 hypothetical protein LOTGIDRAFT_161470 [Lottia gigantea]